MNWEKVCTPKKYGGLGVRDLFVWNYVAMGKIIWQIASEKDTIFVRWIHEVYQHDRDLWSYSPAVHVS